MYEIQFHPANIRKQVRYYFVSRRTFRWLIGGTVVVGLLLAAGVGLAPLGLQSLLLSSQLRALHQQNQLQRDILDQRDQALGRAERQVRDARNRQQQMNLILGAPQSVERGLGGFPGPLDESLSVPEARLSMHRATKLATETQALLTLADELASFARAHEDLTATVPAICPIEVGGFVLTSPFGERTSPFTNAPDFHAGIDLAAREGTPVLATGTARVVFAGRFPLSRNVRWWRYGNVVVLKHGDRYLTIYAHLQEISVRRGQQVARGEAIGTVGNTGWSTSPHLHYEVRVVEDEQQEPVPVDPRIYILDYQWTNHEELLIEGRKAPPPAFDPLPSRLQTR
jgi:murein DD-endopeptidase MepM/ murein hydrolase activator NlpD